MHLIRVDIKNFRSIEDSTISFIPRCKALIGINESGKTNVLHALALLSADRNPVADDRREPRDDEEESEGYIRFVFRFTKEDKAEIIEDIRGQILAEDEDPEIVKGKNLSSLVANISEGLYRVDLDDLSKRAQYWTFKSQPISDGWLVPKTKVPAEVQVPDGNNRTVPLNQFSVVSESLITEAQMSHCEALSFKSFQRVMGSAITTFVKAHLPDCVLWSYSDQQLLPPSVSMAEFASNPAGYEPLRQMFALANYDDVEEALSEAEEKRNGIRNLLSRVSKAATKHLKTVWKDYRDIEINVQPNGDNIEVNIQDKYNQYDFSRRSDGFKRFISFLFLVSAKTKTGTLQNVLYLHDEPDTGLHPSGARHLLKELVTVSKENYVVFSTHSIFMIDSSRIDRHYIVTKKNETTTLVMADASNFRDEEVLLNALGFSAFELLKAENFLFEGWKDKQLFRCAIEGRGDASKRLKKTCANVGFCHAQGVKDVSKVSSLLEMGRRKWIVISDGDKPAKEHQKKYTWPNVWFRYDELCDEPIQTSEDFFSPARIKAVLNVVCERHSVQPPASFSIPSTGVLDYLKQEFRKAGFSVDGTAAVISDLKDELIEKVKPSELREVYFKVMDEAINRLASLDDSQPTKET